MFEKGTAVNFLVKTLKLKELAKEDELESVMLAIHEAELMEIHQLKTLYNVGYADASCNHIQEPEEAVSAFLYLNNQDDTKG